MKKTNCFLIGITLFSTTQAAFSMNCNKASTTTEKTICANPKLKEADQNLSLAYKLALSMVPKDQISAFKKQQKDWLTERDKCSGSKSETESCLIKTYEARTTLLTKQAFKETARKELFKNGDFKFMKVTLSGSDHPESCRSDYL